MNQLLSSGVGGWWLVVVKVGKFSKNGRVLPFHHHSTVAPTHMRWAAADNLAGNGNPLVSGYKTFSVRCIIPSFAKCLF